MQVNHCCRSVLIKFLKSSSLRSRQQRPKPKKRKKTSVIFCSIVSCFLFGISCMCMRNFGLLFCRAIEDASLDDGDFLSEILAEQAREEEELAKMEAEVRELEAIKTQKMMYGGSNDGIPNNNNYSDPKIRKMMGGASNSNMPKVARGGGSNFSKLEDDLRKKEAENAKRKQAQEEETEVQEAERTRLRREAAFEAELKRMNEEQRKKAKQQKARDAKVVKRILNAHDAGRHYAALGVRNLEFQVGPIYLFNFMIGPITLFRTKTKDIKRAYRTLAKTVHPDKNKDGRAEEAFHALEKSAAILTDDKKRSDYDKRIIANRRRRNKYAIERVVGVSQLFWSKSVATLLMAKRIVGPFSTPILVVGSLLI